jgi:hypothetical protein
VEITARNLERAQAEFCDIQTSSTRESLTVQLTFGRSPGERTAALHEGVHWLVEYNKD